MLARALGWCVKALRWRFVVGGDELDGGGTSRFRKTRDDMVPRCVYIDPSVF